MEEKQQREQQFHNRIFADSTRRVADKYYTVLRNSRLFFEDFLNRRLGGEILEYGCGPGSYAFYLAKRGASVTGIDISTTALEQAREKAEKEALTSARFRLMDAERLEFSQNSFDLICGIAILHHLDLDKAFAQLARTMRPTGAGVFMEPLGHNPFINFYRRVTPQLRTVDEHPLMMADIKIAHRYFKRVEPHFFTLQSLFAVPFRNTSVFGPMVAALDKADERLFQFVPMARRYAWQVVLTLSEPRKAV